MKIPEFAKRAVAEINRVPLWAAFLCYQLLLPGRVFLEFGFVWPSIFVMQIFWYNCVLMFFFISFKYLLKIKNKDLSVLALGGFLPYIPLIYSVLMHHQWRLNFINPTSVGQVAFDIVTLCAVHEYNWPLFPELLALFVGSFLLALILTGKPIKSLIAAVIPLYSSFFCLGFAWFAVNPEHHALLHFTSPLADHVTYSIFYGSFYVILVFIAFFREIRAFLTNIFA